MSREIKVYNVHLVRQSYSIIIILCLHIPFKDDGDSGRLACEAISCLGGGV